MKDFSLIRVLVVEDDESLRIQLERMLQMIGVRSITFAENGSEALSLLRNDVFHVVLTDNTMPVMTGEELVRTVRAEPVIKHLKLAMLSGELTTEENPSAHEVVLRAFLGRNYVLPVPKDGLNASVLRQALSLMVGP